MSPSLWGLVVGAQLARKTRPVSLVRGVLCVQTQSSVWAHELSLHSTLLLKRLREEGIAVERIRFVPGPLEGLPLENPEPHLCSSPLSTLPSSLQQALARVEDSSLAHAIEAGMRVSLQKDPLCRATTLPTTTSLPLSPSKK